MLLSKIEGTTPRLLDLTTLPELNDTGTTLCMMQCVESSVDWVKYYVQWMISWLVSRGASRPVWAWDQYD